MQETNFDWSSSPNLVKIIIPFLKALLKIFNIDSGFDLIKRHYGLEGSKTYKIKEISLGYKDYSVNQIRKMETKAIQRVHEALIGILNLPELQVPDSIKKETNELTQIFKLKNIIITEQEIISILAERYEWEPTHRDLGIIRFLLMVLGINPLRKHTLSPNITLQPSWITDLRFDENAFYSNVIAAYHVLESHVNSLTSFDLIIECKRSRKKDINTDDLLIIAKICSDITTTEDGSYQLKFETISSVADKACRVLYESNKPLHIRDIHKEINHKLATANSSANVQSRTLQNQMVIDKRFKPIGRSGLWGLSQWDLQTSTIVEVMKELFYIRKLKLTPDELYEYVKTKRPDASQKSIYAYLSTLKDTFIRVSDKEYELSEWGNKPYIPQTRSAPRKAITKRQIVHENVEAYLRTQPDSSAHLATIVDHIIKQFKLNKKSIYHYIDEMDNLQKQIIDKRTICSLKPEKHITHPQNTTPTLQTLLNSGENETTEYKIAARWNPHNKAKDTKMIENIIEAVAAFLNSEQGGNLIIGVNDKGIPIGLAEDFTVASKKQNRDDYELFIRNSINDILGNDCVPYYKMYFDKIDGKDICWIVVKPTSKPIYLRGHLIIRSGNQKRKLTPQETVEYLEHRNKAEA